jgi:hypothetical protein
VESIVLTWRELLIAVIAILAVYVAELLLLLRAGNARGLRLWRRGAEAHSEHFAATALRRELADVHRQVAELRAELERLQAREQAPREQTPYAQAIDLARRGQPAVRVAESCGISRGEAELIVSLYQRR